jgi:L-malate glycosyltransferase
MKPQILYYSDCPIFAGCENMISIFLNSKKLQAKYSLSFAYRNSSEYNFGIDARINVENINMIPLRLPNSDVLPRLSKRAQISTITNRVVIGSIMLIWKYLSVLLAVYPLVKVLKKGKYDIVHINNGGYPAAHSCYSMVIATKIVGINNVIYVVNNIAQNYRHPLRWLDYGIDYFVKQQVSIFITGSLHAAKVLKSTLNLAESKIQHIPNGVSVPTVLEKRTTFFKEYDINPNGRMIFSTVAILEMRKGHIHLLESIKLLRDELKGKNIPLFLIEGTGSQYEILRDYIISEKLESHVQLLGSIPNIYSLYYLTDVIVLPSISNEDFPNVIIEAMGLGIPVIGTRIAGIPEQIDNSSTGLIVSPSNPMEMSMAIKKIISDPALLKEYSKRSKMKYELNYTASISVDKYLLVYDKLIVRR